MKKHTLITNFHWLSPAVWVISIVVVVLVLIDLATQSAHNQAPNNASRNASIPVVPTASALLPGTGNMKVEPQPSPTNDFNESFLATMVAVKKTLPTPSPVPGWPDDKQAFFSGPDLTGRASLTALALDPPPTGYQVPTVVADDSSKYPPPERTAGAGTLYDEAGMSRYSNRLVAVNEWWEYKQNARILIIAGKSIQHDNQQQGELLVATQDLQTGEDISEPQVFDTPTLHGWIRVTDAQGERLTLQAQDGTTLYFDVPTRQWINPQLDSVQYRSQIPNCPKSS